MARYFFDKKVSVFPTLNLFGYIFLYGVVTAFYTLLANGEFTWITWILITWLGIVPIFMIGFAISNKLARWHLPLLILFFLSPIIGRYLSIWLGSSGLTAVAKLVFATRYYLLVLGSSLVFWRILKTPANFSVEDALTKDDFDMKA